MKNVVVTGLSIKKELLQRIEVERGDVSRSRFLSKLVEQALESDSLRKLPQGSHKVRAHRDPTAIVESKPPIVTKSDSEHE